MKQLTWHRTKKYFYVAASALLMAALPANAQTSTKPNLGPNVVSNAGFENGAADWNITGAEVVSGVAHSGTHSLYYSNTDAEQYKLFSQKVDVKPGQKVRFSVWIKGKDVRKKDSTTEGASLYMQSTGSAGYLGGSFPGRLAGTFDWTKVVGEYTVFPGATGNSLGLYLRKGVTGTVWFDDATVQVIYPPSIQSHLQYPNYRGMTVKNGLPWKYQVQINKQENWKSGSVKIVTTLTNAQGKVLLTNAHEPKTTDKSIDIIINPPKNLPLGKYTLRQTATDPNGEQQLQSEYPIQLVAKMPKTYIDAQGFTVVNGKRFFPFGFYIGAGTSDNANLQRIAKGGFNTVLSYAYGSAKDAEAYMENAQKNNLKVAYSLKDMYPGKHGYGEEAFDVAAKYIKLVRDEPALLAWYTNDELGAEWLPKLEKTYNLVKQLDPNHPVMQVQNKPENLEADAATTDILASDPYPVGSANLASTSRRTRVVVDAAHGAKGVWMVPQSMDWAVYHKDDKQHPPTLDEMRNQAYQSIINGATGLIFYSYYDMMYDDYPRGKSTTNMDLFNRRWADCTKLASEINKVIPGVLQGQKMTLALPRNAEVEAGAWENNQELLIMLANPYYEQKSITLELPKGWKIKEANQGQIKSTFANGKVTFNLPSVGSGVFRLQK